MMDDPMSAIPIATDPSTADPSTDRPMSDDPVPDAGAADAGAADATPNPTLAMARVAATVVILRVMLKIWPLI